MGVVSRRVVPACGNLCYLCPAMRARSRHPVKRYKKMLSNIFLASNPIINSSISKLSNYAQKNPLRIPEITESIEQRCYNDLRRRNYASVGVALSVFGSLLSVCPAHAPLFAPALLPLLRTLLHDHQDDDLCILACDTVVLFITTQSDTTYMFNLEGLIPPLCQLAQHHSPQLRTSSLRALAFMVQFMGHQSHISMDFDTIISVTLENFTANDNQKNSETTIVPITPDLGQTTDNVKSPFYWSRVCLSNMAKLAKEATTVRRVLEPLFQNFDMENHWSSSENGLGYTVLLYLQSLLEESGQNSHLLLSILVKHLDHKNVVRQPVLQISILNIATQLAKNASPHASLAIIGAISDLIKHLRKCMQNEAEESRQRTSTEKCNSDLHIAIEKCIWQFSEKAGDIVPILDMMGVVLENIPTGSVAARTAIASIYETAKIVSSVPNLYHEKKALPDALFHQILLAMTHPDSETRVGAHCIFCMMLVPSMHSPLLDLKMKHLLGVGSGFPMTTCRNVASEDDVELAEDSSQMSDASMRQSYGSNIGKTDLISIRLSSHQVSLLLSSIWVQATSAENTRANFEAMAQSYKIASMFTRSKTSNYGVLVRCFQLAFSLRSVSLDKEGVLQPSRRRSLFTLASFMLIFSARVGNFPDLITLVKTSLTDKTVDPNLRLVDDDKGNVLYGVDAYEDEDENSAMKSLSSIELDDMHLKQTVISNFITSYAKLSEDEIANIKTQVSQIFSPDDDAYPLGAPLFMETPRPCSPLANLDFPDVDEEVMPASTLTEEEGFREASGSQSDRKTSISINSLDVISVNQLLESVLETARQVASLPVAATTAIPYDEMKELCEALVTGKQQKMSSVLHKQQQRRQQAPNINNAIVVPTLLSPDAFVMEGNLKSKEQVGVTCGRQHSFRLPPSSPFDKFLKAAGC